MDNKWKVDKEELDKLILTQTDVTTDNNKSRNCKELIFQNNLAPFVRLDIKPDNIASKAIAKKVGFNQVDEMYYELLNPKAEELLSKLIKDNAYKPYTSIRLLQQLEYVKMRRQQENTKKH